MFTRCLFAAVACVLATAAQAEPQGSLRLDVETERDQGFVMLALYDQATYDGGRPIRVARLDIAAGERGTTFADLPAGDYGVKAFHDLNGNGRMDANPFGMPTEPVAFSNNAVGNMGPAGWDRARVEVRGAVSQTLAFH